MQKGELYSMQSLPVKITYDYTFNNNVHGCGRIFELEYCDLGTSEKCLIINGEKHELILTHTDSRGQRLYFNSNKTVMKYRLDLVQQTLEYAVDFADYGIVGPVISLIKTII